MASSANNIACPKCEILLRPPFTTCSGGHLLCKTCRQHIDAVSGETVASATCGDDQYPMELLNKLLRDITDECQYGCRHSANIVDLAEHEVACTMKPKCSINSCHWRGHIPKLVKHVEDDHPGRLVNISAAEPSFTLGFEHPVLLLTQWHKASLNNVLYWVRLHKNGNSKFIMMQYEGQIGQEVEKKFLIKECSVSPVNYPKLSINIEVVFTKSDEDDILNDKFVESQGTDVTVFNADEFRIKMKDVLPRALISKSLALNLECFICAEIMSAPIRMCATGHSFCDTCRAKINNKCPNCQKEINSLQRNYALEALTENLLSNIGSTSIIPCKYRDSGCQFTDKCNVDSHVKYCEYQPWECAYTGEDSSCQWKGPHKYLVEHIVTEHGKSIRPVNTYHFAPSIRGHYYYHCDNNYFEFIFLRKPIEIKLCFRHLTTKAESKYNFRINALFSSEQMAQILVGHCKPNGEWFERMLHPMDNLSVLNDNQVQLKMNIY